MESRWLDVSGDIESLNQNIFESIKNTEISLGKKVKINNRSIFLNKETGFLHAIVKVVSK